jgi:hypothetical protein
MTATVWIGEQAVITIMRKLGYREMHEIFTLEHKGVRKNVCAEVTT